MVERQPSKLRVAGSSPVSRSIKGSDQLPGFRLFLLKLTAESFENAHVAQLAEYILGKDEVTGSIPVMGSMNVIWYRL